MSHASRRPNREELKAQRKKRNRAQKALGRRLVQEGLPQLSHATTSNGKCRYQSKEEEAQARNEASWEQLKVLRAELPKLLKRFFPELEETPHHDTLKRLLAGLDISELENIHLELIRGWIKKKKFRRYLIDNCYPIAIDGTQKMCRDGLWAEECLERTFNRGESTEQTQHYVYVLQASLAFSGGLSIPVL